MFFSYFVIFLVHVWKVVLLLLLLFNNNRYNCHLNSQPFSSSNNISVSGHVLVILKVERLKINKTNKLRLFLSDDQQWSGRQREGVEEDEPGVGETAARRQGGGAAAEISGDGGEEAQDGAQAEV